MKSNEQPKEKKSRRSHIPLRLNILFLIIFVLFVALIVRLGYMQVMEKDVYMAKIEKSNRSTVRMTSARGQIYDATGKPLVTNVAKPSITYTRGQNISAQSMREIALRLVKLVKIEPKGLTDRDRADFFLSDQTNLRNVYARLNDFDLKDANGNAKTEAEIYASEVEKVTPEEKVSLGEEGDAAAFVYKKMNQASQYNTVTVTSDDISTKDVAVIGENEANLEGIATGTTWDRNYEHADSLRDILGTVSTETTGLPAEHLQEYLDKGYERNDRVGTSYLEQQYEDVLQGKPTKSEVVTKQDGTVIKQEVVTEGKKGDNLKLTIDMAFQKKVEEIAEKYFKQAVQQGKAIYSPGTYMVVMNPNTGSVLAMVGLDYKDGELKTNTLAAMLNPTEPGSVVKGATLTAGYETGVITGNDVIQDTPIKIAGTPLKASVFNPTGNNNRYISAQQALELSSNDYMMKITIRMLGQEYYPDMTLNYDARAKVYGELRKAYAQYGMGIKTGIDLPNEPTGIVTQDMNLPDVMGKLLDLSFGQYDTYTALQLATYASTVANGGNRLQPHVVQGVYANTDNGALGELVKTIEPKVVEKVPITPEQMSIIQNGFYDVVHGNDAYTTGLEMRAAKLSISAKTGTAEKALPNGQMGVNSNVVAYAPSDKPEIAIGLLFPQLTDYKGKQQMYITNEIVNAYYDMYYSKGKTLD